MNHASYLDVLETLHTGVVIHAADTSILFSNRRAAELLGLSESQMLGKTAIDPGWHFVHPDGSPIAPQEYPVSRVLNTKAVLDEMVVGVKAPGRAAVMWVLCSAFPKFDDAGELLRIVVNFHDISANMAAQETLRISEHKYRRLFETVPQGVVYQNRNGEITSVNPAALRILGLTEEQMQGRTSMDPRWRAVREDGSDFPGHLHPTMEALRTGKPMTGVIMGVSAGEQDYVWISCSATPLFENGELTQVYAIFEDITERKSLQTQVQQLAFFDPLTQLPNRRLLTDRVNQALASAKRSGNSGAMLVLDLDNFKPLNDAHGHILGDQLLQEVARRLLANVREVDTVARFGGDEFVVVLSDLSADAASSMEQALAIAEKIRLSLAMPFVLTTEVSGHAVSIEHHCTASAGLALIDASIGDIAEIFKRADAAMYRAKREGRNRVNADGWTPARGA